MKIRYAEFRSCHLYNISRLYNRFRHGFWMVALRDGDGNSFTVLIYPITLFFASTSFDGELFLICYDMNTSKEDPRLGTSVEYHSCPSAEQGDISLLDIWQALCRQWRLIAAITCFVTLVALVVAFTMPEVYRAEVVLLPPLESDVESLNVPDFYEIESDQLYQKVIRNLQSNELRYLFFKKYNLFEALTKGNDVERDNYKVFHEKFNNLLVVKDFTTRKNKLGAEIVKISLDGAHYEQIVPWVNNFVAFVDAITVQAVISAIDSKVTVQERSIRRKINSLRIVAKKQRNDFIAYLNESILVAEKLGLKEQASSLSVDKLKKNGELEVFLNTTDMPMYTRGTLALRAKLEVLKKRKSDDPFIEDLRELEGKLALLKQVKLKRKNVHAVRIDQQARPDDDPIKPKRILIIVLGFMVGLIFAVFTAMIRDVVKKDLMEQRG